MNYQHKELASGRWFDLSFCQQMSNIGSEIERTINWKIKNNFEYSKLAFYRALELIDLTIKDIKNKNRLKETLRLREIIVDYFVYDNIYKSTDNAFKKYFLGFNYASQVNKL